MGMDTIFYRILGGYNTFPYRKRDILGVYPITLFSIQGSATSQSRIGNSMLSKYLYGFWGRGGAAPSQFRIGAYIICCGLCGLAGWGGAVLSGFSYPFV